MHPALAVELKSKGPAIAALCAKYEVMSLALFGSATSADWNERESDVDFVVSFKGRDEPGIADRYIGLATDLERLLERRVDLVTEQSIRNPYFRRAVDDQRLVLYAA